MGRVKVLCLFLAIVFVMGVVPFVAASSASAEGVKVVAGPFRSYAVLSDNSLWGWGRSLHGETWGMFSDDSYVPRKIMDGVASVAAGSTHTMVVKTDGTLWAFGENEYGELGDNTYTIRQAKPVKVMEDVAQVAAGQHHTVALKADGSLWAWGRNEMGQLGNGATTDSRTPLRIMDGVTLVAAGNRSTMAIKADASLWAWGWNQDGQLGDGTTTNRLRPTKIMENAAFVTSTDHIHNHSAVIKTDGSLWLFGYNGSRQFGDDSGVTNELNPLPVKVMDGVVSVAVGGQRTSAVTKDGKLWGWGLRYLDIETLNDVAYVTKSTSHTMIVKTDGSLWAWGSNEHGEIGDGTTSSRFSPVRITLPKASVIPQPQPQPQPQQQPQPQPTLMPEPKPNPAPASNSPGPSAWAKEDVVVAIAVGLVPQNLQTAYNRATTRAEFAALAVVVYEKLLGEIKGRSAFIDTDDVNVLKAAAVALVNGVGGNRFDPDAPLTREQAAVMLSRLADAVAQPLPRQAATFVDMDNASDWARDPIGHVQAAGVMSGVGNNTFSPQGPYTREQSIVTILRMYILLGNNPL